MQPKLLLISVLHLISVNVFSQTDTVYRYLDYEEEETEIESAIYLVKVFKEKPTDVLWKTITYYSAENQLKGTGWAKDKEGLIRHGEFLGYFENEKNEAGQYKDGLKEGEWKSWDKGRVSAINHYRKGKLSGSNVAWYDNGKVHDSIMLDETGNGTALSYYKSGNLLYKGSYLNGDRSGTWDYYYDAPGKKSMSAVFVADSLTTSICYTEKGEQQTGECILEREAEFAGGMAAWRNFLIEHLSDGEWVKYMKKTDRYQVILRFIVNTDGSLENIKVENPRIKKLDKAALKILQSSPPWVPAMQYNRPVKAYRRQPITFVAVDE